MDTLHSLLFLEKLSRDFHGFAKNPNCGWQTRESLEKAFLNKFPGQRAPYEKFKSEELAKWGALFGESFQKHSLSMFVSQLDLNNG